MTPPETCPVCGADVPQKARACPECGACEETGWSDQAYASQLGLPDEDFDYNDFVDREFGTRKAWHPRGLSRFWWVAALVVLASFLWMIWFSLRV
jgi:hypothetical protein